eukprot:2052614-Alexandrium_andersonii.AAC.1
MRAHVPVIVHACAMEIHVHHDEIRVLVCYRFLWCRPHYPPPPKPGRAQDPLVRALVGMLPRGHAHGELGRLQRRLLQ